MNIENCIKFASYILLTLICLPLLPMLVIGSINTLFEGYISLNHNIFTYISFYVILLTMCVRINFNFK